MILLLSKFMFYVSSDAFMPFNPRFLFLNFLFYSFQHSRVLSFLTTFSRLIYAFSFFIFSLPEPEIQSIHKRGDKYLKGQSKTKTTNAELQLHTKIEPIYKGL